MKINKGQIIIFRAGDQEGEYFIAATVARSFDPQTQSQLFTQNNMDILVALEKYVDFLTEKGFLEQTNDNIFECWIDVKIEEVTHYEAN